MPQFITKREADQRFEAIRREHDVRVETQQQAAQLLETKIEARFRQLDQLQRDHNNDRGNFVLKETADERRDRVEERIGKLENFQGRAAVVLGFAIIISGLVGAAIAKAIGA